MTCRLFTMRTNDPKFATLKALELLGDLPPKSVDRLVGQVDEITVEAGTVLIRQGQLNRHAYLIASGMLAVEIDGTRIASVAPGSIVGERTAIEHGAANATVVVTERARVFAVDHRVLNGAAAIDPAFGERIRDLVDERTTAA